MWTVERITEECQKLSDKFNDKFNIPVKINGRIKKTLGRCRSISEMGICKPILLEFSKDMLLTASDAEIYAVIQHEWAHYWATKSTKEHCGHDYRFKAICAAIGCANDKRVFNGYSSQTEIKKYKYEVWCPDCGKAIAFFTRRCKTIEELDECRCKNCGCKKLYYKQNW